MTPQEVKEKIEKEFAGINGAGFRVLGALYGYSLAQQEIGELKKEIDSLNKQLKDFAHNVRLG